jgi:hypothetical protein
MCTRRRILYPLTDGVAYIFIAPVPRKSPLEGRKPVHMQLDYSQARRLVVIELAKHGIGISPAIQPTGRSSCRFSSGPPLDTPRFRC